jgi:hypothetical protein
MVHHSLLPEDGEPIRRVDRSDGEQPPGAILATDDDVVIRQWAARHDAEPATGEATASGPATVDVHDGDAGIRFNFPGVARFRPISWDEWLGNFRRHALIFVYEQDTPGQPPAYRYRLVPSQKLAAARMVR